MQRLSFIFSHSIFVSLCAAGLALQTFIFLGQKVEIGICLFLFFSTLAAYNLYYLTSDWRFSETDKLSEFLKKNISGLMLVVFSLMISGFYFVHNQQVFSFTMSTGIFTVLYFIPVLYNGKNKFQKIGFIKTFLLALAWSFATVFIPTSNIYESPNADALFLFSERLLFIFMLAMVFDSRDSKVDKIRLLHSIATDFSKKTLNILIVFVFLIHTFVVMIGYFHHDANHQSPVLFLSGLAAMVMYFLSLKKRGYYFYYFLVDGLMLFSAIASYLTSYALRH